MDLSFLNMIPLLKNVDFNDPVNQKKSLIVVLGVVASIISIIVVLAPDTEASAAQPGVAVQAETYAPVLKVQEGEDRDQLEGKSSISIFRSGDGQSLAEKLFQPQDSVFTDNPLGNIGVEENPATNQPSSTPQTTTSSSSAHTGQENVFGEPLKPISADDIRRALDGKDNETAMNEKKKREDENRRREKELNERQRLLEMGINPDTGQPFDAATNSTPSTQRRTTSGVSRGGYVPSSAVPPAATDEQKTQPVAAAPEVVISENELEDDDNSFGLGTTKISSISSSKKKEMEKLTVKAMFIEEKKVKSGERIQLLLSEDKGITVDGIHIPKNSLLYATVNIGDRLYITVQSINVNGRILPLNLEAYDIDGQRGIYCPTNEAELALKDAGREAKNIASGVVSGMMSMFGARFVSYGNTVTDRVTGQTAVFITPGYSFDLMKSQN